MNATPDWQKTCVPCEGGIAKISLDEASHRALTYPHWTLTDDGVAIERRINCKTFIRAIEHVNAVATLAEQEQHHPDLHVTGYRHLTIVLTTHAIGGLSENDFIMVAKIDRLLS